MLVEEVCSQDRVRSDSDFCQIFCFKSVFNFNFDLYFHPLSCTNSRVRVPPKPIYVFFW